MTIRKGETWGETVERPDDLIIAASDAELAQLLTSGTGSCAVAGGDLFATVGARPIGDRVELLRLPVDLLRVRLDGDDEYPAIAHVVFRAPVRRGGAAFGTAVAVMNAEFLGGVPVAPRGHPNDGRVEVFQLDPSVSLRQRLAIRRRARSASHLPHPGIAVRSVRSADWTFDRPMDVVIDGRRVARASVAAVEVLADGAVLYA